MPVIKRGGVKLQIDSVEKAPHLQEVDRQDVFIVRGKIDDGKGGLKDVTWHVYDGVRSAGGDRPARVTDQHGNGLPNSNSGRLLIASIDKLRGMCAEPQAAAAPAGPREVDRFVLRDVNGSNYVHEVRSNRDGSFTICGTNNRGEERSVTINADGSLKGHGPRGEVGIVGQQMAANRQRIFDHFDMGPAPKPPPAPVKVQPPPAPPQLRSAAPPPRREQPAQPPPRPAQQKKPGLLQRILNKIFAKPNTPPPALAAGKRQPRASDGPPPAVAGGAAPPRGMGRQEVAAKTAPQKPGAGRGHGPVVDHNPGAGAGAEERRRTRPGK